jgi:calcineurin-like phosphoesterase family protein
MNKQIQNTYTIPALVDGKLLDSDALSLYLHYLSTEKLNNKQELAKPCRLKIFKAFLNSHTPDNEKHANNLVKKQLHNNGNIYYWSDMHFNHKNIIEYSQRPFTSIEDMNEAMFTNYEDIVKENDLVIFGGDVAFDNIDITKKIKNLPGKKILILGNHDFNKKHILNDYASSFDAVTLLLNYSIDINNQLCNIMVTHYPIDNKLLPLNTINIHGHIHQYQADVKNINMSVEKLNYCPKKLKEDIENVFIEQCKLVNVIQRKIN